MNILKRKIANKLNTRLPSSDKPDSLDSYSQQPEVKKHVKHSNSLEIHTLYEDVEPDIDIIAIHGHGGHYRTSFTHPTTQCLWLTTLLPPLFTSFSDPSPRSIRVLSFSYTKTAEASLGTSFIATSFLSLLTSQRQKNPYRPILWLAHSFGGPLLQGLLSLDTEPSIKDIREATQAILFFGVEMKAGGWVNMAGMSSDDGNMSAEMRKLRREVIWLGESEVRYRELFRERRWFVRFFLESAGEEGIGGEEEVVRLPNVVRLGKTHGGMIRFEGEEDVDWLRVKEVLVEAVGGFGGAGNGDEDDAGEGKDGDEGVESAVVSHGRNDAQHQPLVQNVDFVT